MAVQLVLDHEEPSAPYHTVPCTPYLRKGSEVCTSPVATVPEVDTTTHMMQQTSASQPPFFVTLYSPHPSSSIVQVPSISPRTPATRDTNHHSSWLRGNEGIQDDNEQQVPSQSPFVRTTPLVSSVKKITGNKNTTETLHLFSDDDNIFL